VTSFGSRGPEAVEDGTASPVAARLPIVCDDGRRSRNGAVTVMGHPAVVKTTGRRRGRRSPAAVGALWSTTVVIAVAAATYSPSVVATPHGSSGDPLVAELGFLAIYVTLATVGGVVALRRPRHVMGWLFLISAWLFAASELAHGYAHHAVLTGDAESLLAQWSALTSVVLFLPPFVIMTMYLPLVFPDGRLLSPRWRIVVACLVAVVAVLTLAEVLSPWEMARFPANPVGIAGAAPALEAVKAVVDPLFLPVVVAIGVSVVLRFRRATPVERQQFKWVALPAGVLLVFLPLNEFVLRDAGGGLEVVGNVMFFGAFAGLPIGLAIAVLRYRLYDIDRFLSRTVTYAVLSLVMVGIYAAGVITLGAAARALTGESSNQLAVAVSTLTVAAVFHPTRRRIQRAVDRRFNRAHYDTAHAVEQFMQRLRNELDPDTLLTEIQRAVTASIQPTTTSVWLAAVTERGNTAGTIHAAVQRTPP
jgi:hypothetical protein